MTNTDLVQKVLKSDVFSPSSPNEVEVIKALLNVDRNCFVDHPNVYDDIPLPIGYEQTCSQPSIVGYVAKLLALREGSKVLEVGSGCGYQAAIMSELVGVEGHIFSVEYIPELVEVARRNLKNHFGKKFEDRVTVFQSDGSFGWTGNAPYDAIVLAAGVNENFNSSILGMQVPNGLLIYPQKLGQIIRELYWRDSLLRTDKLSSVCFVPLRGENT